VKEVETWPATAMFDTAHLNLTLVPCDVCLAVFDNNELLTVLAIYVLDIYARMNVTKHMDCSMDP
jgi:hypothetical protein